MSSEICQRSPLCDTPQEEVANSVTHGLGVIFSIGALVTMLFLSDGDPLKIVASIVFGCSLILLYLSSTLYHVVTTHHWKGRFRVLDHACIYLLIAGSYTPVTLITLKGSSGWWLFCTVWVLALIGVAIKAARIGKRSHWVSTLLYLAMGWLILFAMGPLMRALPMPGVWWLVAGGFTYSLGIIFYAWKKLPFNHAVWHLFVLGGSVCHVMAVARYVLP